MKTKLNGFLTLFIALLVQISFAQERVVTGVVSDNSGLPIPGVNVLVKGTTSGTQTDIDGKYSISATPTQTLIFNFVGMKSQEILASSTKINAKLAEDAVELEGVVVTALGVKREKKSLGYATQEVKGADLNAGGTGGNVLNDLSGKVAGVQIRRNNNFGGSTDVVGRGIRNLTGGNQMLIVIDGVPVNNSNTNSNAQRNGRGTSFDYGSTASDINPADIESVNVLKGPAASALYGYLAGNGVLMITTKKGKAGKKGMGVTVSSEVIVGSIDKSTFVKYQNKYGAGYGLYYGPNEDSYFNEDDIDGDGNADLLVPFYEDASFGAPFEGQMVYQWDAFTPYSPNFGQKTEWKNAKNGPITFFETPLSLNNSISVEDGNDKSSFLINFSNLKQTGLLPNSELKKNNFSAKFNHKFTEKLSASVFASFINQNTVGRNSTGYNDNIMSNFRQWWQTNVDIKSLEQVYNASGGQNVTWNIKSPTDLTPAYWDNPYFQRNKNYSSDSRDRFLGYINLDYKINDWLSALTRISNDSYSEIQEERRSQGSVASEFGINRLDEPSGYQRYNRTYRENNYDLIFNAYKDYGKFDVRALAGGTIKRVGSSSILASTQGGLLLPGLYSLSNSVGTLPYPVEQDNNGGGVNSYYGQLTLGFEKLFYLEGTVRRDAFASLPKDDNVLTTKSISGSLIFSELVKQSWLNFGKIRVAYAESPLGSPTQSLIDTYDRGDSFGTDASLYSVNSIKNNPNLKPVKTDTKEIGLELNMFNKRLFVDFSMYKSLTVDQIFNVPYSTSTGYNARIVNAGSVQNKGFEVQLVVTPVRTKDFSWDVTLNWSSNRNEVISLKEGIDNLQLGRFQGGVTINAQVGQPFGVIKGTDFTYLDGQRIVGANGRYVINSSSNNNIGNVTPDWIGGVRNKFNY